MTRGRLNLSLTLRLAVAGATLVAAAACKPEAEDAAPVAETVVSLPPEQIAIVALREIRTGPALSGSLEAETQATVRAEIGGSVLQTYAEVGTPVSAGQQLVRIDDTAIRDQVLSARSGVTTAQNQVQVAQRELQRAETLARAGAVAERMVEQARSQLIGVQALEADARARLSSAEQLVSKTSVKAPFAGVVSARTVNGGDVVAPGSPLYTIINPSTMRLEASVPSDALSSIRPGAAVEFTVSGYPSRRFTGRIASINPTADPATRQVRVIVTLPNTGGTLVAGLFAEGRVASEARTAPVVPGSAVDESGVRPWVMRLKGGKAERVEVTVGIHDPTTETVELRSGVAPGDTILLGAARGTSPGTPVRISSPNDVRPSDVRR